MNWLEITHYIYMTIYTITLAIVCIYGFHRYSLVYLYFKHRKNKPVAPDEFKDLPRVTIQLPMFNERFVADRIIRRTCEMDYPKDKLQIQVLDDSTDDTEQIAQKAVDEMKAKGFDITLIHRIDRTGYKAGALENGMKTATGEFISIFDADFMPRKDFLMRTVHHFTDPKVCVVQSRWEHINKNDSLLTKTQAILLDGHFGVEHIGRNRSGRFMQFNGTGGTWRREAIADAGGWCHDTLTEDLDLSYRAQMKGWKFVFLPDLVSPAELPPHISGFKAQQFRWTKGGAQNTLKLLPTLMKSNMPFKVKLEGFFHLTGFCVHIFMLALILMMLPAMLWESILVESGTVWRILVDMSIFVLATMSATVFYCTGQHVINRTWHYPLKYFPMLLAIAVGLSVSNTKAVLEALLRKKSGFVRTPKFGEDDSAVQSQKYIDKLEKKKINWLPWIEIVFGLYMAACTVISLINIDEKSLTAAFLAIFTFGFFYVAILTFTQGTKKAKATDAEPALAEVTIND